MSEIALPFGLGRSAVNGTSTEELTDADIRLIRRIFGNFNVVFREAPDFFAALMSLIEVSGIQIPISQVPGYQQTTAKAARVSTGSRETTSSTTPTALSTAGPTVTELPAGQYAVVFGCDFFSTAGAGALMGVKVNSTEPTATDAILTGTTVVVPGAAGLLVTLTADNNTLEGRYWVAAADTGSFNRRFLIALRYANP